MVLNKTIGVITRALGKLRPALRLHPTQEVVKINVGAGLCPAPGWLHVEGSIHGLLAGGPRVLLAALHRSSNGVRQQMSREDYIRTLSTHEYVFYNLDRGLPLADGVADFVYSSHVLEHFYPDAAEHLIGEMFRVLKPGGVVRICVPDLEFAVSLYQKGEKQRALGFFFAADGLDTFAQHLYMYDFEMLAERLRKSGFVSIIRRQYREGVTPDLDKLDNRPDETLYVEAQKPLS